MQTTYKRGQRVRHPKLPEWGLGMVLDDSAGDSVRIFWVGVGEKRVSLKHVNPTSVTGEEAASATLDNLRIDDGKVFVRYKSLPASMDYFLSEFPGGFYGERFLRHERTHKEEVSKEMQTALRRDEMASRLEAGDFRAICEAAIKLTGSQANAMIFKSEKIALRDGLKADDVAKRFAESLFDLLHGDDHFDGRFDAFADVLESAGACKWTIATYFPFFMHPDEHMFVKPTITQNAAEVCAFDINYRPEVNARTYRFVLAFSRYLQEHIAELKPRDMIDVQSFMWCIAPGSYGPGDT